jgi:uncharacterized protein YjbI with pentapeptide repeats
VPDKENAMKNMSLYLLFALLCSACLTLSGCGNPSNQPFSSEPNKGERGWYFEHELFGQASVKASEDHTVVLTLKPSLSASANGLVRKTIPFTFTQNGTHSYCIPPNDPYILGMSLIDSNGTTVMTIKTGECKEVAVAAGTYTKVIEHTMEGLPENGMFAFIGREKKTRLIKNAVYSASSGNSAPEPIASGWLALRDESGNVMTLSPETPIDKHANYFWVAQPLSAKGGQISLDDLVQFTHDASGAYRMNTRSKGALGGFVPKPCKLLCPPEDTGYGQCGISTGNLVQSPLYTYSSENKGTPPIQLFALSDLGNYSFTLSAYDINRQVGGGYFPLALKSDKTACYANNSSASASAAKFTVWFRYFDDGTQVPSLQEGEIALFSGANYTGKAWVFAEDIPDFSKVQGLSGISSVKTGPNTKVTLALTANTQDFSRGWYIGGSNADLSKTTVKTSSQAAYISQDVTKFTISSASCRYCDLTGIQIPENMALGFQPFTWVDFTGATLSNAVFNNSNIKKVNFTDAILTGFTFRQHGWQTNAMSINNVDFTNACLDNGEITSDQGQYVGIYGGTTFKGASMKGITLSTVNLAAILSGADMSGATISNTVLSCAPIESCFPDAGTKLKVNNAAISRGGQNLSYFIIDYLTGATLTNSKYFDFHGTRFVDLFKLSGAQDPPGNLGNVDFSGAVFPDKMDFSGIKQACADPVNMTGCLHLDGIQAQGANFKGAILKGATMSKALLMNCDLSGLDLSNMLLSGTNFYGSNLLSTQFNNANLDGAKLCKATLSSNGKVSASFSGAFMRNVLLSNVTLTGVNMDYATFYGDLIEAGNICQPTDDECRSPEASQCASAANAVLSGTSLVNAFLANNDFTSTAIYGASFSYAKPINANFTNSTLREDPAVGNGDMIKAWLHSADFTNAKIENFNLDEAFANNDYSPNSSSSCYVMQLPQESTNFAGYWGTPQKAVCVKVKPKQNTRFPYAYGPGVTCPDGLQGQCGTKDWNYGVPDPAIFSESNKCEKLPENCTEIDLNW